MTEDASFLQLQDVEIKVCYLLPYCDGTPQHCAVNIISLQIY